MGKGSDLPLGFKVPQSMRGAQRGRPLRRLAVRKEAAPARDDRDLRSSLAHDQLLSVRLACEAQSSHARLLAVHCGRVPPEQIRAMRALAWIHQARLRKRIEGITVGTSGCALWPFSVLEKTSTVR